MLWMGVPTFAKMFKDMGAELPEITQFVVNLSDFIVKYGVYIGIALGIVVAGITVVVGLFFLPETFRRPADG